MYLHGHLELISSVYPQGARQKTDRQTNSEMKTGLPEK